jgi:hypothetical protein
MKESSELTVAILDTLTNINLKTDLLAEVFGIVKVTRGYRAGQVLIVADRLVPPRSVPNSSY